ncbi:MAG: DUF1622 domain-containing protein [Candidatus Brocadia sp.]|nr:DUF1622 domain-containing protein [Candidatus Brocadia sp.]
MARIVVTTILSPSWQEIERLGAIVTIRIAMNFFLNRDIKTLTTRNTDDEPRTRCNYRLSACIPVIR